MTSMRDIKQRISNVGSTRQIVKAMDMIASTKLNKSRNTLEGARPMFEELRRVTEELSGRSGADKNAFYEKRRVKNSLYIVVTSDKGFSGGYNSNICLKTFEHMASKNEKILVIGTKGHEFFKGMGKNVIRALTNVTEAQIYFGSENIANWLREQYLSEEADEVFVAYTHFNNILNLVPQVDKILPITAYENDCTGYESFKEYEPDLNTYIDNIMPLYLHMNLFRAFLESQTSEQAARMVNMDAAEKNASDMIEDLTRMYNRKRQTAITQELSEIVGGANTLDKGRNT